MLALNKAVQIGRVLMMRLLARDIDHVPGTVTQECS